MKQLHELYRPLTAEPYRRGRQYAEAAPPDDLAPYVRCFWGTDGTTGPAPRDTLVIPDTCVDLMFHIDEHGAVSGRFCALYDRAFVSPAGPRQRVELFAVRFYPWAAGRFAQESLRDSKNGTFDARAHFPALCAAMERALRPGQPFAERCARAAAALRRHMDGAPQDAALMNAVDAMLRGHGATRVSELARSACLSPRQLERRFGGTMGVSPKALCEMVRYQCLWRDALARPRFDVQDAVLRYGFSDQAHLLRQFRRYHSLSLRDALAHARRHVAFVQDKPDAP